MQRRAVIGVMGAGESASQADVSLAEELGERIARHGWALLTGGRNAGVMAAANRGAKRVASSLTLGILPAESGEVSPDLDVAVFTGMGNARNVINVLTSRVVIACGSGGPGTASEVALALKAGKPVILLAADAAAETFFRTLGGSLYVAASAREAVALVAQLLRSSAVSS
ncbi:MAG: cytochrome [Candidatus Binatia bacterium]